jgi:hypothetical protein
MRHAEARGPPIGDVDDELVEPVGQLLVTGFGGSLIAGRRRGGGVPEPRHDLAPRGAWLGDECPRGVPKIVESDLRNTDTSPGSVPLALVPAVAHHAARGARQERIVGCHGPQRLDVLIDSVHDEAR